MVHSMVHNKVCPFATEPVHPMTTKRSDHAYPLSYDKEVDSIIDGMTKREYFAIMIMQGLTVANLEFEDVYQKARLAVAEADALIDILSAE